MSISERPPEAPSSSFSGLSSGSLVNAPYWLLVWGMAEGDSSKSSRSRATRAPEILSLDLADGRVLPVFGSEEDAALFARAWTTNAAVTDPVGDRVSDEASVDGVGGEWLPRGTGAGELISLLSGSAFSAAPCAGVERVALDQLRWRVEGMEHGLTEGHVAGLVSMSRGCFLEGLMGRGRAWFDGTREG